MTNNELINQARECAKLLTLSSDAKAVESINLLCERLEYAQKIVKKWIALKEEIAKFYIDDENETESDGDLLAIGQCAAIHLGFL